MGQHILEKHPDFHTVQRTYERYKDSTDPERMLQILKNNYGIDIPYADFQSWTQHHTATTDREGIIASLTSTEVVGLPSLGSGGGAMVQGSASIVPGSFLYDEGEKDPVFFAEEILKMRLHDGQKAWLRETMDPERKKNILVPSNQFGKTTVTAVKHIWLAYYKRGLPEKVRNKARYETLALSPKLRQSRALYGYIIQILTGNLWWETAEGEVETNEECLIKDFLVKPMQLPSTNQLSHTPIQYRNGAMTHVASTGSDMGAGLAGGQFTYISYDECPLSINLKEELPGRIQSRLIRYGGDLDLIGTPDIDSDSFLFYQKLVEQAIRKEDGWWVMFGKLDDNTFIPEKNREAIKKAIKSTDPDKYRQVVYGEFVRGGSSIFPPGVIEKMWDPTMTRRKIEHGAWEILPPDRNGSYVIGVDWALANDFTIMLVMRHDGEIWKLAYFYRIKGSDKPPQQQYLDLMTLKHRYNASVIMDTNGLGGKLIESEFKEEPDMHGFNFGPGRKAGLIGTLKKALFWNDSEGRIKAPYIPEMEEELGGYKIDDKKIRQDIVMALALCTWFIDQDETLPDAVGFSF